MRDEATGKAAINYKAVRRFALWTLGVSALNLVAEMAAIAAMFGFFNKNYLLAALPTAFALPVFALQPWLLFLHGLPGGSLLAVPCSAMVTVAIYGALNRAGKLEGVKNRVRKVGVRRALVLLGLALVFVVSSGWLGYTDALPQNRGIPRFFERELRADAARLQDSRYYVLSDFFGAEMVWRAQVRPDDLGRVMGAMRLPPLARSEVPGDFARKPPLWWRPNLAANVQVFGQSQEYWNGEGTHALAVYEPETQLLYVWFKNNF